MFPEVEEYNASTKINQSFPLMSLLPPSEDMERYYTYWGSLTTPPCSEAVTWILFPNPLPISGVQVFMCNCTIACLFDSDWSGKKRRQGFLIRAWKLSNKKLYDGRLYLMSGLPFSYNVIRNDIFRLSKCTSNSKVFGYTYFGLLDLVRCTHWLSDKSKTF